MKLKMPWRPGLTPVAKELQAGALLHWGVEAMIAARALAVQAREGRQVPVIGPSAQQVRRGAVESDNDDFGFRCCG